MAAPITFKSWNVTIDIHHVANEFSATIKTKNLQLESVKESTEEYQRYTELFKQCKYFLSGKRQSFSDEDVRTTLKERIERWKQSPFSRFSVFTKNGEFIGFIGFVSDDQTTTLELECLFDKEHRYKKTPIEAARVLIHEYVPQSESLLDGQFPIVNIYASAFTSELFPVYSLDTIGMKEYEATEGKAYSIEMRTVQTKTKSIADRSLCIIL